MYARLKHIERTPWFRLASTYLLIIMIMSIGFSFVFYKTGSHELGRQLPPHSTADDHGQSGAVMNGTGDDSQTAGQAQAGYQSSGPQLDQFLQSRVQEGRTALLDRLILLNALALVLGSGLSYYLALRTLKPIEAAMEAQSQFVSDASHELRTPLTSIQTANEVALRDPRLSLSKAKAVIAGNSQEAAKLKALSDGLLNLAKQDRAKLALTPVSAQDVVSQAMTQVVQIAQSKDIAIEDAVPKLQILADNTALVQVLVILLDNAVKYSPEQSAVHIEGHRRGHYAYLRVRDAGMGIRASDLPHIFRRFYRADMVRGNGAHHGYGLGLSIARKLVEQQQGSISAHSEPGKGAVFTIRLGLA